MSTVVFKIKQLVLSQGPDRIRLFAMLASLAIGVAVIASPGAGSGIGG